VAFGAQRDEVPFLAATRSTEEFAVVHLQVLHATARLASPAIAIQHLTTPKRPRRARSSTSSWLNSSGHRGNH